MGKVTERDKNTAAAILQKNGMPVRFIDRATATRNQFLLDDVAAALAGARAPEWRPIETAPRDGTRILIRSGCYVCQGFWDREAQEQGGQCWREDNPDWERAEPSDWMPLPDPPEVKQ
jgi:hypothetical protein